MPENPRLSILALLPLAAVLAVTASFHTNCATVRDVVGVRGQVIDKPGLSAAVNSVWSESYRRSDRPPAVRIVEGADLNCTAEGGIIGFETPIGCRNGYTASPFEVSVGYDNGVRDFGWDHSMLAHELRHAVHLRRGILDGEHKSPDWRPVADCQMPPGDCGIVDRANKRLRSEPIELDTVNPFDADGGADAQ